MAQKETIFIEIQFLQNRGLYEFTTSCDGPSQFKEKDFLSFKTLKVQISPFKVQTLFAQRRTFDLTLECKN